MFCLDYHLFVNLLKFCDKSHLFSLLLTSKEINELTWRHLVDFLDLDLSEITVENYINRNMESVDFLLRDSRVELNVGNNYLIGLACFYGDFKIVKFLLQDPSVYPNDENNYAIRVACMNGHMKIVKLLLDDHRIDEGTKEFYRKKRSNKHNLIF